MARRRSAPLPELVDEAHEIVELTEDVAGSTTLADGSVYDFAFAPGTYVLDELDDVDADLLRAACAVPEETVPELPAETPADPDPETPADPIAEETPA